MNHLIPLSGSASALTCLALGLTALGSAQAAVGDTHSYAFNAASTGGALPTTTQATLVLTETAVGVDFVLSPDWVVSTGNFVDTLTFAYSGESVSFVDGAGPTPSFSTGAGAIDSGYSVTSLVTLNFPSGQGKFDSDFATSAWSLNGSSITLADFQVFATATSTKPSPAFGVISMPGAVPSNWVAMGEVSPVPEPGRAAMLLAGMLGMGGFISLRRPAASRRG